jgi:CO/xanthine dehydrogenase FAD-binding subunit
VIESVEVPSSAAGVVAALTDGGAIIAGGTILMPKINNEATDTTTLVSTRRIGNASVDVEGSTVRIGAATTLASVGRHGALEFLRPVIESIGSPTIRNMATVGGNLFAPAPYGDLAAALVALDAHVEVLSPSGSRTGAVEAIITNGVAANELVTSVQFNVPAAGGWFYTKAMRRKLNSASIVTIVANLTFDGGSIVSARVGLGGCAPTARRSPAAEAALAGGALDEDTVAAAARAAIADTDFFSDEYASAWYRERVFPVHFRRALLGEIPLGVAS